MNKLLMLFLVLILSACTRDENNSKLAQSTPIAPIESNPVSEGSYRTGDAIMQIDDVPYGVDGDEHENVYYFGGFIVGVDIDTFVITEQSGVGYNTGVGLNFYYKLENGMVFNLPRTNIKLKVINYNINENWIQFQQLQ